MKYRGIGMCIFLSVITCGIYGLYWYYCLNNDVADCTGDPGTSGGMVILFSIISCGIYLFYWSYRMGEKLDNDRQNRGVPTGNLSILYLILSIFGLSLVTFALMQSEVNRYSANGGQSR